MRYWIILVFLSTLLVGGLSGAQSPTPLQKVIAAFEPISGSPWARYADLSRVENPCIENIWNSIPNRNTPADRMAAKLVGTEFVAYQDPSAIIVDSGGPHSIAIATKLAQLGYQPIVMMSPITGYGKYTLYINIQAVGAMKEYWPKMLLAKTHLTKYSPPAFILDAHSTTNWSRTQMPSPSDFHRHLVWITEAPDHFTNKLIKNVNTDQIDSWFNFVLYPYSRSWLTQYSQSRVKIWQHEASPYFGGLPEESIRIAKSKLIPAECNALN